MNKKELYMAFIDLEKSEDRVLREVLQKDLEKKDSYYLHSNIKDMYGEVTTSMRRWGGHIVLL